MNRDFKLPDLGEGVHEGRILHVLVAPGDSVREDQPLLEVETDKAAVVIPCPFTGIVQTVHIQEGQLVHVGDTMVTFTDALAPASAPNTPSFEEGGVGVGEANNLQNSSSRKSDRPSASATTSTTTRPSRFTPASPAVRRMAREAGLDLNSITGSGPAGRVTRADVDRAMNALHTPSLEGGGLGVGGSQRISARSLSTVSTQNLIPSKSSSLAQRISSASVPHLSAPPQGTPDHDTHGDIIRTPVTMARKTIAAVMTRSLQTIPHVTDTDDADVTDLEKFRKGFQSSPDGPKITMLAFIIRAVVRALERFPDLNAAYDADRDEIIYKRYINIAVGVHTERGLVPMVLRGANYLGIAQLSDALSLLAEKARTATFSVNETRGGTFTVSNAGAVGGSRYSTPIITPGQTGVLAIGKSRLTPWVIDNAVTPRLIMPLSHSFDHRLVDGGVEIAFMQHIIQDLQNPARMLL